jgi:hypothetical protein
VEIIFDDTLGQGQPGRNGCPNCRGYAER